LSTTTAGGPLLRGAGLAKRYRGVAALDGVDVDLEPGESLALLGPNGAGKTTLLRILAGVTSPTAGILEGAGTGRGVGWVPQRPAVYHRLTARENLRLFAALEGAGDPDAVADRLLERADLLEFAGRPASELSTGTLQRLNLSVALAGAPVLLLLDEPTATLSPDQRQRLWAWLEDLRRQERMALLFSTQSVDEAAERGDRMLVLVRGRVAFAGTADELSATYGADDPEAAFLALLEAVA